MTIGNMLVTKRQRIGGLGSLMLILGAFAPLVSMPIVGNVSYFNNGSGDGMFILAAALLSLLILYRKKYQYLWATGLLSLALLSYTFIRFQNTLSEIRSQMETELANNPFAGIAQAAAASIQLQWGFPVMIIGAVLLLVAAGWKKEA